jgi:hypothetical protein
MPQPVHYSYQIDYAFLPEALLERPHLAAQIAAISALWNDIEARIAAFLAALAGPGEAETVIALFHAITNDGAKRAAADALTTLKLSGRNRETFKEAMLAAGRRYVDRNTVVHGSWGTSPVYPDKLLWCDVRDATMLAVDMMGLTDKAEQKKRLIVTQKKIMVYGERDFIDMRERMREAYNQLHDFTNPFMERSFGAFAKVDWPPHEPRSGPPEPPDPSDG